MATNFFNSFLQKTQNRIKTQSGISRFLLDKNEQSEDIDCIAKSKVLSALSEADWNRYPTANLSEIESKVAQYCGLLPENIVLSAGSAAMITTLLNYFAINRKEIHIVQPSYSLFDYHCKTYNIPYTPWSLTEDLEYDADNLPALNENSVLIITTPNNPIGNSIAAKELRRILEAYPDSLIVVDAVYAEFGNVDFTSWVNRYENLLVIRSFSKAFPMAGVRLGYLCAAPSIAALIKKLVLPFSLNHFTIAFAQTVLFDPDFIAEAEQTIADIIIEREMLYASIKKGFHPNVLKVYPSEGNFLLIRIHNDERFEALMNTLNSEGIKVLNTSSTSLLKNTFRVSIGTSRENESFFQCLMGCFSPVTPVQSGFKLINTPKIRTFIALS